MFRYFFMLVCLCIFTACERASELTKSPDTLGDFSLGYPVVVAPHPVAGPMSRPAFDDEWRPFFYARHTGDNKNSKRQAFSRARGSLVKNG